MAFRTEARTERHAEVLSGSVVRHICSWKKLLRKWRPRAQQPEWVRGLSSGTRPWLLGLGQKDNRRQCPGTKSIQFQWGQWGWGMHLHRWTQGQAEDDRSQGTHSTSGRGQNAEATSRSGLYASPMRRPCEFRGGLFRTPVGFGCVCYVTQWVSLVHRYYAASTAEIRDTERLPADWRKQSLLSFQLDLLLPVLEHAEVHSPLTSSLWAVEAAKSPVSTQTGTRLLQHLPSCLWYKYSLQPLLLAGSHSIFLPAKGR